MQVYANFVFFFVHPLKTESLFSLVLFYICRAMLGALSYMMLAFGSLLAHLLSKVVPWLAGLCVLNVVILVTHFIAIGFFHPETPRFLFAVKVK